MWQTTPTKMAQPEVMSSLTLESDDQIRARCLFITQLRQHIDKCEQEENYMEAERCRKRLSELQQQDKRVRIIRLRERHKGEIAQLEQVMQAEVIERREAWNEKLEKFELRVQDDIQVVKQRQQARRTAEEKQLMDKFDTILRPSR